MTNNAQAVSAEHDAGTKPVMRITAFDHVRGLAAIFMIVPHVIIMFGTDSAIHSPVGIVMDQLIGDAPAAPVFMLLMGVFLAYPGERPLPRMMSRGVRIYLLGTVLNVLRLVVPIMIAVVFLPETARQVLHEYGFPAGDVFYELGLDLDVLQFAGIAFILISVLQRFIRSSWLWVVTGAIIVIAAPHLWGTGRSWGLWYDLVQPLWGNELTLNIPTDTAFPVFPWLAYPIAGIIVGKAMAAGRSEDWLLKRMLGAGLVLFVGGWTYVVFGSTESLGDYYRMYPGGTSLVMGFALVWTCFFMWLSRRGLFQNALNKLVYWSRSLTLLYCVQWVLLGFSILIFGYKRFDNPWISVALTPVYICLTYVTARRLEKIGWFMRGFRWFLD